jgi:hypothetical protein
VRTTRRAVLAGAAATAPIMPLPSETLRRIAREIEATSRPTHPDADLIRTCAEHIANRDAFNAYEGNLEPKDNLLWRAYCRTWDAIRDAKPQTIEGIIAKARAAKAEAQDPDGTEDPEYEAAADWSWHVVNDLLRVSGKA